MPPQARRYPAWFGTVATTLLTVAVAAGLVFARAVWFPDLEPTHHSTITDGGLGSSDGAGSGSSAGPANVPAIAAQVDPGLVDINTTLGYQSARAAGTGIVLTDSGIVLTNNHVIDGATTISVTDIADGRRYHAEVVGYDRTDDIAILQLNKASGLRTSTIGDSTTVTTGEPVVAIGNAGGAGGAPSAAGGAVAALNRSITASDEFDGTSEQLAGLIEVSADVQPGDSGGPLVNASGQVIGVDTAASANTQFGAKDSKPQGSGQGFAIPINKAMFIGNQIRAGAASNTIHIGDTGFLGVQVGASGSQDGQPDVSGASVRGVVPDSPAQQAGLGKGDVITSVNGQNVTDGGALTDLLGAYHPGDDVRLSVVDHTGQRTVMVLLTRGPAA